MSATIIINKLKARIFDKDGNSAKIKDDKLHVRDDRILMALENQNEILRDIRDILSRQESE